MFFFGMFCRTVASKRINTINESSISLPLCLFNFWALSPRSSLAFVNMYYLALDEILNFIPSKARFLVFTTISVCERRSPCCKSPAVRFRIKLGLYSSCQEILSVNLGIVNNSEWIFNGLISLNQLKYFQPVNHFPNN